jgi:PhnB protein
MQLQPYVFFYGRCEEALEFYKAALGGTYEAMRVADAPADVKEHMPPGSDKLIMHASFTSGGLSFLCADGRDVKPIDPDAGNISLALAATDTAEGDRVFKALSDGGKVTMPLDNAFWGGRFGMIVDRFGNEWMITSP